MAFSLICDLFLKDPYTKYHPIAIVGTYISFLENIFYKLKNKIIGGILLFLFATTIPIFFIYCINYFFPIYIKIPFNLIMIFFMFSCRTLIFEAEKIKRSLEHSSIEISRKKLSMIVGRSTENLSREKIIDATVETVAENTIDGVVSPAFFMIIGLFFKAPLEGVLFYKIVNTLDSMVGYKSEKYIEFGKFSAIIDDILNFIPARIGSFIMLLAGAILNFNFKNGFKIFIRDRKKHLSPNSAHSESAVAGLLGIRLGGPNYYHGKLVEKDYIGDELREIDIDCIDKANSILFTTDIIIIIIVFLFEIGVFYEFSWWI